MKTILVVDDSQEILDLMEMILVGEGYLVVLLDNGQDVKSAVDRHQPSLILLDIVLGNMDGRDICSVLKSSHNKNIPIIMFSATHGLASLIERQCPADGYIAKPFELDDMISTVHKFVA
ncbi:response regulator transcription factor [Pedobacter aquatilis]|uniref:response regulator transcription factor n=1 Tax=Pedobacter aquatilis TaxID=351343 RepID=UPI00292EE8F8|nr:response regulator [Pedobacter aquatilis]